MFWYLYMEYKKFMVTCCNMSDLLLFFPHSVLIMRVYLAVFTLCLSAVFAAPTLDKQLDDHWEQWKNWHSKKYHEVSVKGSLMALH